jgi:WhiB family transcriptional regulator, redox-sensing transcriptional regulator
MTDVQLTGWRQRAKCAGLDTELFYPEPATGAAKRAAKAVCARCDVKLECLLDALATSEQFGIRGGLTARERRTMTRRLREQHGVATRPRVATPLRASTGADHTVLQLAGRDELRRVDRLR